MVLRLNFKRFIIFNKSNENNKLNGNEIQLKKKKIFLILNFIVLVMVIAFSNNAHAQELHQKTLYEIKNHTFSNKTSSIPVGKSPIAIGVNQETNTIYVVNLLDDTVSVIDGENNTKIGKDIPVGNNPSDIGVNMGIFKFKL